MSELEGADQSTCKYGKFTGPGVVFENKIYPETLRDHEIVCPLQSSYITRYIFHASVSVVIHTFSVLATFYLLFPFVSFTVCQHWVFKSVGKVYYLEKSGIVLKNP